MSLQFGRWNFDGTPVAPDYIEKVQAVLRPYSLDGTSFYSKAGVYIVYRAYPTTSESRHEAQPCTSESGAVITWDGRLDNRKELLREFRQLESNCSDVSVVAVAFQRWGTGCFAKLIGDWAVSVWQPNEGRLILAKDPIGIRHLYYSQGVDHFIWSTVLDPLVLCAGRYFPLEEEYIAGWLSLFPAAHLTPFAGIRSVKPACFVRVGKERQEVTRYWDFDPAKRISYRTDSEYEEHFRAVFAESVRRRLRSDSPILAELSGGMDSSSIVCMADGIISAGETEAPRLDTVSYYDDNEPNWNERPYFTKVEEERGCIGCHIDVSGQSHFSFVEREGFVATPGSFTYGGEGNRQLTTCMARRGNRVVLSGIGGDEVTGGVPSPLPELGDLLVTGRLPRLAQQLKAWALYNRRPCLHLLVDVGRRFLPMIPIGLPKHKWPVPWLRPDFVKRNRFAVSGYESRFRVMGPLPSFQANVSVLEVLRGQIMSSALAPFPHEKRYPFLDRDLLEFLYAIPREQHLRPGQRRSLMRRALTEIVPSEILNRRRKAFVSRSPIVSISSEWTRLREVSQNLVSSTLGFIDPSGFSAHLHKARLGHEPLIAALARTLCFEFWLRSLIRCKLLTVFSPGHPSSTEFLTPSAISAEEN